MINRLQQKGKFGLLSILILFHCLLSFSVVTAQENELSKDTDAKPDVERPTELTRQIESTRGRLVYLMSTEQRKELLLVQLLNQLTNSEDLEDSDEKTQLEAQIKSLRDEITVTREEFDTTLTGGIEQIKLESDVDEAYNWRNDLEEIMKPIFRTMKGVTEKPREIERLRSKINFLGRDIELSKSALAFINQLEGEQLSDIFLLRISTAKEAWYSRLYSLEEEHKIVEFQLQTRLDESSNFFNNFGGTLKEFASGRGLSIAIAIFAFWSVWMMFAYARKAYRYVLARRKLEFKSGLTSRVLYYVYQILAGTVAFVAMILVFYVNGDWIMLGVSMLILASVLFSIKNVLPKFIVESKLLLNVGPVREGERIFYQGIPWKVDKIRIYTELFNPLLSGGRIRVQLNELVDMNSRPYSKFEDWFPCREGDMLLMPEGRLVKVELQTPDFVKLNYTGGATTTVRTIDFLSMSFTNLSEESFRVSSFFGIDYSLQNKSTSKVPAVFREEIQNILESQNYGKYLKVLRVELHEAAGSSLTYKIIADFHGIAARYHNIIARELQSAAIEVCNNHGWLIPFEQLTINQASIAEIES